ncbi:MAG: FoF1 ATP synthase subunit gamma [Candidatus Daviesbacteria bacterium]
MATVKQIRTLLEDSQTLKTVAQAYTGIAAEKLQKIRAGIERNRKFYSEINEVFHIVNVAAYQGHYTLPQKKQGTVSILLTSNHHFFGNIENRLISFYLNNTAQFQTDRIIVGRAALEHFQAINYVYDYKYFILKEDLPNYEELRNLAANFVTYEQIFVYYSRMESVVVQTPHVVDLIQNPPQAYLARKGKSPAYIFEPELQKMLEFFHTQVAALLLDQIFLESELARTASRLMSMDRAQANADNLIKAQLILLSQAKNSELNMQLLETAASLMSMRKESKLNFIR